MDGQRFTEQETMNHDDQTRNQCSSNSGGIKLVGFGVKGSKKKCTGTLENTAIGHDTKVKRFISKTYGSLPPGSQSLEDWSYSVKHMMDEDGLSPVPIKQSLAPILEIMQTSAVANIKHPDGTPINVTKVLQTAVHGYRKYQTFFKDHMDYSWACAKTLLLDNNIYHLQPGEFKGRIYYKNEDDELESKYLFYSNGFTVSTGLTSDDKKILTSAHCPETNAEFEGPLVHPSIPNIKYWNECAKKCYSLSDCNYWQHNNDTKICSFRQDYTRIIKSSHALSIGSSDCPGNSLKYTESLCAEKDFSRNEFTCLTFGPGSVT